MSCDNAEDISCLTDALLPGGGRGPAPNLERLVFEHGGNHAIGQLGSHLFARGALANIITLKFSSVNFNQQRMADLVDGFDRAGIWVAPYRDLSLTNAT